METWTITYIIELGESEIHGAAEFTGTLTEIEKKFHDVKIISITLNRKYEI